MDFRPLKLVAISSFFLFMLPGLLTSQQFGSVSSPIFHIDTELEGQRLTSGNYFAQRSGMLGLGPGDSMQSFDENISQAGMHYLHFMEAHGVEVITLPFIKL